MNGDDPHALRARIAESAETVTSEPFELPGGWRHIHVDVGRTTLRLTVPASVDALLDHDVATDEYDDPYWAHIWPAAAPALETLLRTGLVRSPLEDGATIVELGAGTAILGLGLAQHGYRVTITDRDARAMSLAQWNAQQNELNVVAETLDWNVGDPEPGGVYVAADILYDPQAHRPLLRFLQRALPPDGVCWIGDPGRNAMLAFVATAESYDDLAVDFVDADGRPRGGPVLSQFQLLSIRPV